MNPSTNHDPTKRGDRSPAEPEEASAAPAGATTEAVSSFATAFAQFAKDFPSALDRRLKRAPYTTVAIASAAGMTVGVVLSSRILRSMVTVISTAAAIEVARSLLRAGTTGGHREGDVAR